MRLSDMVAGLGPAGLTELAMVIFLAVFAGIVVYVAMRGNRKHFEEAKQLPFDDGVVGEGK